MNNFRLIVACVGLVVAFGITDAHKSTYGYECRNNVCESVELHDDEALAAVSFSVCRLLCGKTPGTLWPQVNGPIKMENATVRLTPSEFEFNLLRESRNGAFWKQVEERTKKQILRKIPKSIKLNDDGSRLMVMIDVENDDGKLNLETNEQYRLEVYDNTGVVLCKIKAPTIFGARHALETLSQLVVFDEIRDELQIVRRIEIDDKPEFAHRGFLLDTARNYFSVDAIKRTIDGMAMVKLNVFHWHMTDSQSFPLVLKKHPDLVRLGAYSPEKVYTIQDIIDVYNYAYNRGVILLPEFDAPAHVGEGWQLKNVTSCFNYQPWAKYCVEPPCGQLDPTVDHLYDILEDIYSEMYPAFQSPDLFHMGGDEVSVSCWNSSERIRNWMLKKGWRLEEDDFMRLWGHFQDNALERLDRVTGRKLPIIMWTSRLTDIPYVEQYLDKARYIIQIWTTGFDTKIHDLLKLGYKLILSNYDALYLDCGFGGWVAAGSNWCAPYAGWEKVYNNNFTVFGEEYRKQFIGAEAALWSEQTDEHTLDDRLWPRLSALAERLWLDPRTSWRDAEPRMLVHRQRLVENGLAAEMLQPEWCLHHQGQCPI